MAIGRAMTVRLVREHRRLRRELPAFAVPPDRPPHVATQAARRAVRVLETDVLGHADREEAALAELCPAGSAAARLVPSHDQLRDLAGQLRSHLTTPQPATDVSGLLRATRDLLVVHLDDEWRTFIPLLADLDHTRPGNTRALATLIGDIADPGMRTYVPRSFAASRERVAAPAGTQTLRSALARAARRAVTRAAHGDGVALRDPGAIDVDLTLVLSAPRLLMLAGRLRSGEPEPVLAPAEFELVLSPRGDRATIVELHHTLVPTQRLAAGSPALVLTPAALHAVGGHVGRWLGAAGRTG